MQTRTSISVNNQYWDISRTMLRSFGGKVWSGAVVMVSWDILNYLLWAFADMSTAEVGGRDSAACCCHLNSAYLKWKYIINYGAFINSLTFLVRAIFSSSMACFCLYKASSSKRNFWQYSMAMSRINCLEARSDCATQGKWLLSCKNPFAISSLRAASLVLFVDLYTEPK